ncbi:restriction endonuclease subunit S [Domibacillus indicus]|uniref:restriction endonuclease subunit S n=1 Tax=Domibacillus indicus TaxID=1437523 RepID=UPI000617E714|nr:restriction endonuclease subunit S [Domibacillus indicus]
MNAPKLRLKGNVNSWTSVTLGELLAFNNGINADKDSYGHGRKFINVLDILNNNFITYDKIIGSVSVSLQVEANNKVEYGDILFLRSSETREDVGKSSVYLDSSDYALYGGFVIRGKKIAEYNPYFLKLNLETPKIRNQIGSKAGGSTRFNVSQGILSSVEISLTTLEEQQQIADFFTLLDQRIEKQQEKIELLKAQKKGLVQKIFSQEIRFRDENGELFPEWNEYKIGDIFDVTRGVVIAKPTLAAQYSNESPYPVYSSQTSNNGILGWTNSYDFEGNYLTWTTDGANAGKVFQRSGKFKCTNVCGLLVEKEDTKGWANKLVSEALNRETPKHVSYVGNPKLMNGVMSTIKINLPTIDEQKKISNFLSKLELKIEKEEAKLKVLKGQKKSFMQKMFI